MMLTHPLRWTLGLALATTFAGAPALAAFDIDIKVETKYAPALTIEKPTPARNFGDHAVSYLRVLPKKNIRAFPAFINTHNYLTCPDSDKRVPVGDVKQVSSDRRSGVKVLGFFFDKPDCENPTFHVEAILAD